MTHLRDAQVLVVDTETSGLTHGVHSPVEVGMVLTSLTAVIASASTLVNPGHPICNGAKAVHHIMDEDVQDCPDLATALRERLIPVFSGQKISAFSAHNADFDSKMLPSLNKRPWLCTYRWAKKLFSTATGLESFKNQYLRYEFNLDVPEAKGLPAHRALADAFVTAALYRFLAAKMLADPQYAEMVEDIRAVIEWIQAPSLINLCPFKKHKDKPWEQVVKTDPSYVLWLLSPKEGQDPLDTDTAFTINHWMARRGHPSCDLCGEPVTDGHRDIVTNAPRHSTCVPF